MVIIWDLIHSPFFTGNHLTWKANSQFNQSLVPFYLNFLDLFNPPFISHQTLFHFQHIGIFPIYCFLACWCCYLLMNVGIALEVEILLSQCENSNSIQSRRWINIDETIRLMKDNSIGNFLKFSETHALIHIRHRSKIFILDLWWQSWYVYFAVCAACSVHWGGWTAKSVRHLDLLELQTQWK